MERDIWPGVELVDKERSQKSPMFFVGPITEVGRSEFSIYCYDAAGCWEKTYKLEIQNIFKIIFDDMYTKHFNRYMRTL